MIEFNLKTLQTNRLYTSTYKDKKEDLLEIEDFKNYKYIFSHQRKENRNFSQKAYKTQKHLAKFSARLNVCFFPFPATYPT